MISRRDFMRKAAITAGMLSSIDMLSAGDGKKRPDIIFFISDDHGWRHSEPYGDTFVKTPNMTRLAKESVVFTNAYAASPLCSPSHSAIATGLMPHRNGGHFFGTPVKPGVRDIPAYLNDLGYHTVAFGKTGYRMGTRRGRNKGKRNGFQEVIHDTGKASDYILNYREDKPLYMHIGSHDPHLPWTKNDIYDPDKIPLPPNYVDTPEMRLAMADYYMDVTVMDRLLGSVLDALEKRGTKNNTLFIYTTDQGAHLPFAKWCLYDGGLRVPFIARWPGTIKPNSRTDAMINLVDLMPTFVDVAGGTAPDDLDGRSILPVLNGTETTHRDVVFGTHSGNRNGEPGNHNNCPMRSIRTATHRYIFNLAPERLFNTHVRTLSVTPAPYYKSWQERAKTDPFAKKMIDAYEHRPREELYDVCKDPYEMNNLAGLPEQAELLKTLKTRLAKWCESQGDLVALEHLTD